jgi:hypothetical protein
MENAKTCWGLTDVSVLRVLTWINVLLLLFAAVSTDAKKPQMVDTVSARGAEKIFYFLGPQENIEYFLQIIK